MEASQTAAVNIKNSNKGLDENEMMIENQMDNCINSWTEPSLLLSIIDGYIRFMEMKGMTAAGKAWMLNCFIWRYLMTGDHWKYNILTLKAGDEWYYELYSRKGLRVGTVHMQIYVDVNDEIVIGMEVEQEKGHRSVQLEILGWKKDEEGKRYDSKTVRLRSPECMSEDGNYDEAFDYFGKLPRNKKHEIWIAIDTNCYYAPWAKLKEDQLYLE